jgi:hypothetical protein
MVDSGIRSNKSEINFLSHTIYVHASHASIYSASAMLSATDFYFPLPQDIIAEPKLKHILEVLFMSSALPA